MGTYGDFNYGLPSSTRVGTQAQQRPSQQQDAPQPGPFQRVLGNSWAANRGSSRATISPGSRPSEYADPSRMASVWDQIGIPGYAQRAREEAARDRDQPQAPTPAQPQGRVGVQGQPDQAAPPPSGNYQAPASSPIGVYQQYLDNMPRSAADAYRQFRPQTAASPVMSSVPANLGIPAAVRSTGPPPAAPDQASRATAEYRRMYPEARRSTPGVFIAGTDQAPVATPGNSYQVWQARHLLDRGSIDQQMYDDLVSSATRTMFGTR